MMIKYFRFLLFTFLFFQIETSYAIDPSSLIKVTPENKPKCVEYYTYQGDLYCSTTAQSAEPVDPNVKDYEKQKIVFDDRPWQAAWGQKTPNITTVEYIPSGDNIDDWHELVTSQFLPDVQVNPMDYVKEVVHKMKESGFDPIVDIIEQTPDRVLFEFRIESPDNMKQDELQLITKKDDGLYILHYVIKEADMGEANRAKWVANLKNSQ